MPQARTYPGDAKSCAGTPAVSNSSSEKKWIASAAEHKLRQSSSRSLAPGKRPAIPITAISYAVFCFINISIHSSSHLGEALTHPILAARQRFRPRLQRPAQSFTGAAPDLTQTPGEGLDRRIFEQLQNGQLGTELLHQTSLDPHQQHGVAPQVEEVVVDAHPVEAENPAPDRRQAFLEI